MNIISLKNIYYKYSQSKEWTLENISICFKKGEITIILGPNGSGKTTLMKIASLIYKPIKGDVYVDNKNYWSLEESEKLLIRRKITYVHEKAVILKGSVIDNIIYGLRIRGMDKESAIKKAIEILNELEINDILHKNALELSAGQSQIISLARALVLEPLFLFIDEPFSHLDKSKKMKVIDILKRIKKERGIIISLHEESLVEKISPDNLVEIENGRIVNIKTFQY
ncbi:MAG: ATP-binding cassette domain-containing protein [Candidatus Verstraetearchaeota archaeon]|nr:ATP-binding cassette domain-containing protein [Candidatus Verstraetearchaeota archaeon]